MARKLRVQYPGAIYHLMSRGDRREPIVRDDRDREVFIATLGEACAKTGWQLHALCLLPNHFHLVVETPEPNLVAGMKWLLGTFTNRINRRHGLVGHLFSGRYRSLVVDGTGRGYLRTVCDYVHLNPVRARLIPATQPLHTYRWSSWPEYMQPTGQRWPWLRVDRLLGEYGLEKDSSAARRHLERELENRRRMEESADYRGIRRGWFLGDDALRQELLAKVSEQAGALHYGEAVHEAAEAKAERIVAEELRKRGWKPAMLGTLRKGDPEKLAMAGRLRAETTMTLAWIAARLHMGTRTHLAHLLYWRGREGKEGATA